MKKKIISILGSTGSIGLSVFEIINLKKNFFKINLLSANKNYNLICKQIEKYKPKYFIIGDKVIFKKLEKKYKKVKILNDFNYKNLKKSDLTISAIPGIAGLYPTLKMIKSSKKILIANKESIICGWNLIQSQLNKHKTKFIPVDSEHFSIWYGLKNYKNKDLEKIFLTASGGPFYKTPLNKFKKIKVSDALKHPNWKMGKKISTDSATMINKVYEVIEARKLFDISYQKIKILMHPKSYIHAILKFNNGMTNVIVHDTTMKIPIFNTLFLNSDRKLKTKKVDLDILNNLNLNNTNSKRFPMIKLLDFLPDNHSLFETVIVAANDKLVEMFLNNKIQFTDIQKNLFKIIKKKEFQKFKKKLPINIKDITNLNDYVRLKIDKNNI